MYHASSPAPHVDDVYESRTPAIWAATITTFGLAVIAVALRFWARRLMKASYKLDDWLILADLVREHWLYKCLHRDSGSLLRYLLRPLSVPV